tara:strand:- start:1116 stop:1865 length:750 start_codon:yes stop_codon:yes gene_type:complete
MEMKNMQPTRSPTRSPTKQDLIPIFTDLEDETEEPIPVVPPSPEQTPTPAPAAPEEPVAPPRPGGEKIPPGGWRGAETPRPGGEKIPPGGWRSDEDDLRPGDWRSRFPPFIETSGPTPPLTQWDGEVYRTADGHCYFHFKTTITAHIIPPEEIGTGSIFATLIHYWAPESGLISIESICDSGAPTTPFFALSQMSTHVPFHGDSPEEIHQAFTQLQSQLSIWAETLWTYINEQEAESNQMIALDDEEEI